MKGDVSMSVNALCIVTRKAQLVLFEMLSCDIPKRSCVRHREFAYAQTWLYTGVCSRVAAAAATAIKPAKGSEVWACRFPIHQETGTCLKGGRHA
jgi:hypothetical protein